MLIAFLIGLSIGAVVGTSIAFYFLSLCGQKPDACECEPK